MANNTLRKNLFITFCILFAQTIFAAITPTSLVNGVEGITYNEVLFKSDKVNPKDSSIRWEVSGAPLAIRMDDKTGKYFGKPNNSGTYTLSILVWQTVGSRRVLVDKATINHTINATTPPTINGPFTIPSGQYDQRYQQLAGGYRLTASGDYPFPKNSSYPSGFRWDAIPGASTFQSLPDYLKLSPDGVISGVPTGSAPIPASNQTYTFKAKATDLVGKFSIATFTLTILRAEPPEIVSACPLPEGLELFTYPAVTLKGAKGKPDYSWTVSPTGSLPPGLVLDPRSGIISGKPTLKGLFNFEIILRDKNGLTANKSCSINIRPAPEIIKKQIFACLRVGDTAYEEIEAMGGDQPYTWSVTGAPPGIGIVQTSPSKAKIGGNFTQAGFFQANIKASEKGSRVDIEQFSFEVRPALGIATSSPLPFGIRGYAYPEKGGAQSVKIEPSGGWAPYSWQLLSGQLPLGLSISPSTGVISGTPTKTGTFKFTVRIKDSCKTPEKWVDKEFEIVIYDPITIFADPIPCLTINKTFSSSITASGGALPYTWQIVSSTSPAYQISVPSAANSKVAQISGVPEKAGPVALTVSVTSLGITESFTLNHTVNPELQITSACPPSEMTVGSAYAHSYSAIGGKGNYTWSINQTLSTNGTFPAGLILSGNKIIGTPSVPAGGFPTGGESSGAGYTIAVDVRDECGNTATKVCSATLYPALENPVAAQLCLYDGLTLNGTQLFSVSGGKPPYTWGSASGLPSGLTLSSNGSLSGTITGAGNFTISTSVTDSLGNMRLANCSITVNPKLVISSNSTLPVAYKDFDYSATINATGGTRPYSWSINSTSVDPNNFSDLEITHMTNNSSKLSGWPSVAGNYTFSVTITDSCGQSFDQVFSLNVKEPCFKELWIVVDCGPFYSDTNTDHYCNKTQFKISANKEEVMNISLNNAKGPTDWVYNPGGTSPSESPSFNPSEGYANGKGMETGFVFPRGLAVSNNGTIYIAEKGNSTKALNYNNRIRQISFNSDNYEDNLTTYGNQTKITYFTSANVSTFAGIGSNGTRDGIASKSQFNASCGVAVNGNGTVYVADTGNHRIRKITSDGVVSTFAGNGTAGFADGSGTITKFSSPSGIAVDGNGTVYVADTGNHRIRKITSDGVVSTFAGNGTLGSTDGSGALAKFSSPLGIAVASNGTIYVADTGNHLIRKISSGGVVSTFAGNGTSGFADGNRTVAKFSDPGGVAVDGKGMVYVADTKNHRIRVITSSQNVTTLAGGGTFIFPHPEWPDIKSINYTSPKTRPPLPLGYVYPPDTGGPRYNRVLIGGEKLIKIFESGNQIQITAACHDVDCPGKHIDGVGQLTIYTSNSTKGIFKPGPDLREVHRTSAEEFKPDPIGTSVDMTCKASNSTQSVVATQSLALASALFVPNSPSVLGQLSMVSVASNANLIPTNNNQFKNNTFINLYNYKICAYEINNQQYTDFLNMVAKADPNNLYNTLMTNSGIQRDSGSGSFTYSVDSGAEDYPVIYVSWYDAARYANWLTNGRPTGSQGPTTTENGAYNLASSSLVRNAVNPNTGAPPTFWLLNESEWYTSAYLKSDASALWTYPTQSNTAPEASGSNPSNFANFGGVLGGTTPVGFLDQSPGPFGTFDQGGNVREWTETIDSNSGKAMRIIRGGSWADPASAMRADESHIADPSLEDDKTGFRIGGAP